MQKPTSLRDHLTAAVPQFATAPDSLAVYVTKGRLVSAGAQSLSFEYHYTLEIIATDFAATPDAVMVPLLDWVRTNQPGLLDNEGLREKSIRFMAEILNQETVDISLEIDLTERVIVQRLPEANPPQSPEPTVTEQRWLISHPAEPPRLGEPPEAQHITVVDGAGETVAEWDIPAARY
jgi:hypothetical protein